MSLEASLRARVGVLDLDVEVSARDDEVVAILGPNGAGKSTVLRILAGLRAVDAGRVVLDGEVLDDASADVFVVPERRSIGMVFQDYLLFPSLSALDNVAFGLRSRRVTKRAARATAQEWLERVGLGARADAKPGELSGGQAQRVALARALASRPRMLLLDEPLAALDVGARGDIRRELRKHLAEFAGVRLLVTHDPVDAATLADRLYVVESGRLSQSGTFAEISAHPRSPYVAELVGLNLFRGHVRGGVFEVDGGGELAVVGSDVRDEACAVVSPRAVSLHAEEPRGSPRNRWSGTVTDVDVVGDRARVRVEAGFPLVAEVTPAAVSELALAPGRPIWCSVKATEIEVFEA